MLEFFQSFFKSSESDEFKMAHIFKPDWNLNRFEKNGFRFMREYTDFKWKCWKGLPDPENKKEKSYVA